MDRKDRLSKGEGRRAKGQVDKQSSHVCAGLFARLDASEALRSCACPR